MMKEMGEKIDSGILFWARILVAVSFGIGFHFLVTITFKGNDIRVCVTDIFLPFVFIFVLFQFYKNRNFPSLKIKYWWVWLIVLSAWVLISFFVGFIYSGSIQKWALLNKGAGWFVLMGYFLCGAWVINGSEKVINIFLKIFIMSAFFVAMYSLIYYWLLLYDFNIPISRDVYRAEGFSDNPNAFGILTACIFVLQVPFIENKKLFNKIIHYFISSILLLSVYYSLSRSAWLGIILGCIGLVIIERHFFKIIFLSIIFSILINLLAFESPKYVFSIYEEQTQSHKPEKVNDEKGENKNRLAESSVKQKGSKDAGIERETLKTNKALEGLVDQRSSKLNDSTIKIRFEMFKKALSYWAESPIFGIGIGGYAWKSKTENVNPYGYMIHNTGIWLLTEMGLVGFMLFFVFFLKCFIVLINNGKNTTPLSVSVAGIILVMAGASVGTEILYQRYLWFFLGLALVLKEDIKRQPEITSNI